MHSISPDGYLRLSIDQLRAVPLIHLVSGVDEEGPADVLGGAMSTIITGYTEWISQGALALTIGWDWQFLSSGKDVRLHRVSEPRSNIMLQDESLSDLGPAETATLLGGVIDALDWQGPALAYIQARVNT